MGTRIGIRRNAAKLTSAAAGLLLAATVLAPSGPATAAGFRPHAGPSQDSNWGGYVAPGSFTSIIGTWIEPRVTCNSTGDLFAPWIGLDGYGSQTVEQVGVQTDCSGGTPELSAWYELYPATPVYWRDPISEGDSITASVVTNGAGGYSLTLTDNTKGWTERVEQTLSAQDASAEAVIESPTQSYPSFSRLDFSHITVNGRPFDTVGPRPLTSGGYAPGPILDGSFALTPTPSGTLRRSHGLRPRIIRY